MAGEVKAAAEALEFALKTAVNLRVHRDLGANVDPPALVLGPPALTWEGVCLEPTEARFLVYVVVRADEYALERLWALVPQVSEALDGVTDAAVRRADPGSYPSAGVDLPAYSIQVDYAL